MSSTCTKREYLNHGLCFYFASLKNFYEMNDVEDIKWKKLKRYAGEEQPKHEDRRYMVEEIHQLVQNANLKLKATILLMASSGIRIGALPSLMKGHIERRGDLYKISVYKGQKGKGQILYFLYSGSDKSDRRLSSI